MYKYFIDLHIMDLIAVASVTIGIITGNTI